MPNNKAAFIAILSALALFNQVNARENKPAVAATLDVDPPDSYAAAWSMFPHIDRHWMLDTGRDSADGICSEIANHAVRFESEMKSGKSADDLLQMLQGNKSTDPNDPLKSVNDQQSRINETLIGNVWNNYKEGRLRGLSEKQIFDAYDSWCGITYRRVTE